MAVNTIAGLVWIDPVPKGFKGNMDQAFQQAVSLLHLWLPDGSTPTVSIVGFPDNFQGDLDETFQQALQLMTLTPATVRISMAPFPEGFSGDMDQTFQQAVHLMTLRSDPG